MRFSLRWKRGGGHVAEFAPIELIVLGGRGYVASELLRLLAGHPRFRVVAATGRANIGASIEDVFPTLVGAHPGACFIAPADLPERLAAGSGPIALVSCLPHGVAAEEIGRVLAVAESSGRSVFLVDTSSDFRHDAETYSLVHGTAHPDLELLARFTCALPDVPGETPSGPIAHPGCFTTAVTLPLWPIAALGALRRVRVSAITGSSGSGREPSAATHHPERHGNVWAYRPLVHQHAPEMRTLLSQAAGSPIPVDFVPHSGPFVRGIHATIFAELAQPMSAAAVVEVIREGYRGNPFVAVGLAPPRLSHVVGTNRIAIGVAGGGDEVLVTSAIDNLGKGAAGGTLQWLNRVAGLEATTGLLAPALSVG